MNKDQKNIEKYSDEIKFNFDDKLVRLFPKLDYTSIDNNSKTIGLKKKYWFALTKVANDGVVTSYNLKKTGISAQPATDVIHRLDVWGLLKIQPTIGQKQTDRNDALLTAKGVIACMSLTSFQSTEKVRALLEKSITENKKLSKLATFLNIYNEYSLFNDNREVNSSIVDILHELTEKNSCIYFDCASEDDILKLLQKRQEDQFLEKTKSDIFQASTMSMLSFHPNYRLFDDRFGAMKELMEKPELATFVMPLGAVAVEALLRPEIHALLHNNGKFNKVTIFQEIYKKLVAYNIYDPKNKTLEIFKEGQGNIDDLSKYLLDKINDLTTNEQNNKQFSEKLGDLRVEENTKYAKLAVMESIYREILQFVRLILKAVCEVILELMPTKIKTFEECLEEIKAEERQK